MEITTRNLIDIERYTNNIREVMLKLMFGGPDQGDEPNDMTYGYTGVAHAFDRATTSALFKHLTSDRQASALEPPGLLHGPLKASKKSSGKGSGGPKPGSAAAKARAAKASQTRAANKAARAASGSEGNGAAPIGSASRPATGFGGLPQSGPGGI